MCSERHIRQPITETLCGNAADISQPVRFSCKACSAPLQRFYDGHEKIIRSVENEAVNGLSKLINN
jgi:hypothetical protein